MILADKITALRKKAGWSQEELAEQLGVTRQSVSKWEGAQSVPDMDKVVQMSRLFGVTTDFLLKDELSEEEPAPEGCDSPLRRVTMAEASEYLALRRAALRRHVRLRLRTLLHIGTVCLLLAIVSVGCFAFVLGGVNHSAMQALLEEEDYTRENKAKSPVIGAVSGIYWLLVTAVYLFYTFGPMGNGQPKYSWFIWAVAGVLFGAVMLVVKLIARRK